MGSQLDQKLGPGTDKKFLTDAQINQLLFGFGSGNLGSILQDGDEATATFHRSCILDDNAGSVCASAVECAGVHGGRAMR